MPKFLCPQAPVSGTRSPVLLPCFPIGVPFPLSLPKSTRPEKKNKCCSSFFVLRHQPQAPTHWSCCPVSLVSRTPRMHCVCALVRNPGAGCSAVLGSLSLPQGEGAGVRGTRVPPGCSLYLTPFARRWVLACVDVVWLLYCVFCSLF